MNIHGEQRPVKNGILICDFGSQYTLLIAKKIREMGIYNELVDGVAEFPPKDFNFEGIILSGGPDQISSGSGRGLPKWVLEAHKPVLGICYGMQLLVDAFNGHVKQGIEREYGQEQIVLTKESFSNELFYETPEQQIVWMSHGDHTEVKNSELFVLAKTTNGVLASVKHHQKDIYGLQFHPEVMHTEWGALILRNFAIKICQLKEDWNTGCIISNLTEQIKNRVKNDNVLLAVSGGVDSSVAALILTRALSAKQVTCVFIDHGFMRLNEVAEVTESLKNIGLNLVVLDKSELFYKSLRQVHDPEEKRKKIGQLFVESFEKFAEDHQFSYLGQGTLYSDVIESAGHGAGSKVIKSHHNVGGLPEKLNLELIEPFRYLFKDEVRKIGESLGLPKQLIERHPFPGPGLAIRISGEVSEEKVKMLQLADSIFIESLKKEDLYKQVWQAAVILLPVKSVGVMGDNRTYQLTCVLRAVTGLDAMTAKVAELPMTFLSKIATEIVRKVDGINRVLYDVTSKPPATIEWE